tara:strand:- start:99 stop:275 length:177 start_codon:yes stop_codon:yes gene_type:complete
LTGALYFLLLSFHFPPSSRKCAAFKGMLRGAKKTSGKGLRRWDGGSMLRALFEEITLK